MLQCWFFSVGCESSVHQNSQDSSLNCPQPSYLSLIKGAGLCLLGILVVCQLFHSLEIWKTLSLWYLQFFSQCVRIFKSTQAFFFCLLTSFLPPVSYSPWFVSHMQEAPEPPVTWAWRQEKKGPDGIKRYAFLGRWWLSLQSGYQQGDWEKGWWGAQHHCKGGILPYSLPVTGCPLLLEGLT